MCVYANNNKGWEWNLKGVGIIEMTMCPITQITSYTNSLDKFYKSLFFTVEHCLDRLSVFASCRVEVQQLCYFYTTI